MAHSALPVLTTTGTGASRRGSHQLATIFECPRKWYLRYRKRLRERVDKPYRMGGTLHHAAIARRYAERIVEQDIWPAPTWLEGALPLEDELQEIGAGFPHLVDLALEMYQEYPNYWWHGSAIEPWEPVAVEEQFFARLGDLLPDCPDEYKDEVVTCGTDLVVRNLVTKMLWIVDHKSKGFDPFSYRAKRVDPWIRASTGGGDHEKYRINWQVLMNLHIVRQAFPDEVVAGFIVNRFTRDKPFMFDRHPLKVSPLVYNEAPKMMLRAVEEEARVDGMVAAGRKPEPYFWSCHGEYGCCDYIDVCSAHSVEEMEDVVARDFVIV